MACVEGLERSILTFGLHEGDVHAENLVWDRGRAVFDILHPGGLIPIKLKVPGTHNVANALAAAAARRARYDGI